MYESIEASRIIAAFQRNVPGVFVRDYRDNKGFIVIGRQIREMKDHHRNTTVQTVHQTLCNLPTGMMTRTSYMNGPVTVRPGWDIEMRKAAAYLSDCQKRAIERDLGTRVFAGA